MNYKSYLPALMLLACVPAGAQNKIYPSELQIKTAVMAAPLDKRDSAMVYGYSRKGEFVVLREGKNNLVCLADNPKFKGISVSCYFNELEPFMARGRDLTAEGKNFKQKMDTRGTEIESGELKMPLTPTVLYAYWGSEEEYDTATGEIKDGLRRYVVYIPYATGKSTGLPTKPDVPGMPWLMDEGTHKAHIMINPPEMSHKH